MNHPSDDPDTCCPSCNGHGVVAPSNRIRTEALDRARLYPEPKQACEHGQHWLLCEHCGERGRRDVGEVLGKRKTLWAYRVIEKATLVAGSYSPGYLPRHEALLLEKAKALVAKDPSLDPDTESEP